MPNEQIDDGWGAHRLLVQDRLERIANGQARLDARMRKIEIGLVVIKTKTAFYSALGAMIISALVAAIVARFVGPTDSNAREARQQVEREK